jgi:hypothetical protein
MYKVRKFFSGKRRVQPNDMSPPQLQQVVVDTPDFITERFPRYINQYVNKFNERMTPKEIRNYIDRHILEEYECNGKFRRIIKNDIIDNLKKSNKIIGVGMFTNKQRVMVFVEYVKSYQEAFELIIGLVPELKPIVLINHYTGAMKIDN